MKNIFKRLTVVLALVLSVMAIALFAGCEKDNGKDTDKDADAGYLVIYAELEDGTRLANGKLGDATVQAQWCVEDGGCTEPVAFDENGKAKYSLTKIGNLKQMAKYSEYNAHVIIPEDYKSTYEYEENAEKYVVSAEKTTVTIVIKKVA